MPGADVVPDIDALVGGLGGGYLEHEQQVGLEGQVPDVGHPGADRVDVMFSCRVREAVVAGGRQAGHIAVGRHIAQADGVCPHQVQAARPHEADLGDDRDGASPAVAHLVEPFGHEPAGMINGDAVLAAVPTPPKGPVLTGLLAEHPAGAAVIIAAAAVTAIRRDGRYPRVFPGP